MAYVYGHYKADTGELFYIGKGNGKRAWSDRNRSRVWHDIVEQSGYTVKILADNLSESESYAKERELIEEVGLDKLANVLRGGNWDTITDEWKECISNGLKQKYASDENYRERNKALARWKSENEEYKQAATERNRKLSADPEWRKKVSDGVRKKQSDPEYRVKMSEAQKGKVLSKETKAKISQRLKGRKLTEEDKQKKSEAAKRRWAAQRAAAHFVEAGYKVTINEEK